MPIINVSKIFEAMKNGTKFIWLDRVGPKNYQEHFFYFGFIFALAITDLKAMRMLYIHLYLVMFILFKW